MDIPDYKRLKEELQSSVAIGDLTAVKKYIRELSRGCDYKELSRELILIALKNEHIPIIKYFLENGTDTMLLNYYLDPTLANLDFTQQQLNEQSEQVKVVKTWYDNFKTSNELFHQKDLNERVVNIINAAPRKLILLEIQNAINKGANIHASYENALIMAVKKGYIEIVQYLVEKNANILILDNQIYRDASAGNHQEVLQYLLDVTPEKQKPMQQAFIVAAAHNHVDLMKFLVKEGLDIRNGCDNALDYVFDNGHMESLKYLIEIGFNHRCFDDYGLKITSQQGFMEMTQYLIEQGCNIEIAKKNGTADIKKYIESYELNQKLHEDLGNKNISVGKVKL